MGLLRGLSGICSGLKTVCWIYFYLVTQVTTGGDISGHITGVVRVDR